MSHTRFTTYLKGFRYMCVRCGRDVRLVGVRRPAKTGVRCGLPHSEEVQCCGNTYKVQLPCVTSYAVELECRRPYSTSDAGTSSRLRNYVASMCEDFNLYVSEPSYVPGKDYDGPMGTLTFTVHQRVAGNSPTDMRNKFNAAAAAVSPSFFNGAKTKARTSKRWYEGDPGYDEQVAHMRDLIIKHRESMT